MTQPCYLFQKDGAGTFQMLSPMELRNSTLPQTSDKHATSSNTSLFDTQCQTKSNCWAAAYTTHTCALLLLGLLIQAEPQLDHAVDAAGKGVGLIQ